MKIGVVIQGPTNYFDQVVRNVSGVDADFVWSTWDDEPSFNVKKIKEAMNVVQIKKPSDPGFGNVNLQCSSTTAGIESLKNEMILKIRSDMIVDDWELFLSILKNKSKLTFLCAHNIWQLGIKYAVDYISFGNKETMQTFWYYSDDGRDQHPAEVKILRNYCEKAGFKNFDAALRSFDYFLADMRNSNLKINWLKQGIELSDYIFNKDYVASTGSAEIIFIS